LVILTTKNGESLPENIAGEGHSAAGWSIGWSVELLLPVQSLFIWAIGGR